MPGSVTGIKAGRAFILIEAVDATGKILNSIRMKMGKFGTELSNIGRTMALRAVAALTPAAFAVKSGTAYDDIMRKVEARSEGTAAEMAGLREQTLKLGRAFGLLPSGIGSIQNIFAQAGFNRSEISSIAPAVALLARAGGEGTDSLMDMDNAAKSVGAVLRGFEMDASESSDVVDKLAIALNASNFNLEDITTSLQYAVPAAKFYNVTLEEMLSILGAMRDLQIDSSIAGTAFRNMMMYMSQPKEMEKFNEELTRLTGRTIEFKDAVGNLHSPMKLLPAMLKATEGMGTADRSALFSGILQARATIPGAAVGRSTDRMAEMMTKLENFKGTANRVQKQMDSGLGGAFRRFAASVEEAAIKFTDALAPSAMTASKALESLVKVGSDWIMKNQGLTTAIIASVIGFLALGTAMVVAGQSIIALSALFGIGSFLASATAYLLAFVAPWAAAATGIYLVVKALDDLAGEDDDTLERIGADLNAIKDTIFSTFGAIRDMATPILTTLYKEWSKTFDSIVNSLKSGDIGNAFKTLSIQLQTTWQEMVNFLMGSWEDFGGFFADVIANASAGLDEIGARAAGLHAYHFEAKKGEDRDQVGARAYEAYKEHARGTREGLMAENANSPEAILRRKRQMDRAAQLEELRRSMAKQQKDAAAAVAKPNSTFDPTKNPATDASKKRKEMEDAAAALIGTGKIIPRTPKGGVEGIKDTSLEFMKQFQENKYNLAEAALTVAEESRDHLAAIERGLADGGIGIA